jgi:hypothetical protein
MFLGHVRSPRNIGSLCSSIRPRNISTQFVNLVRFSFFPALLHPVACSPCTGHLNSALATPGWPRPALPQPGPALPWPHSAYLGRAPTGRARRPHLAPPSSAGRSSAPPRPAARADRPALSRPRPAQPHALAVDPASSSSACLSPGPASPCPGRAWQRASTARPGPSHRRPVPASAYSSSESRAPLYINFFLIKINEFMRHAKNTMNR